MKIMPTTPQEKRRAVILVAILIALVFVFALTGCDADTIQATNSDAKQAERTEQMMQEANSQVGMPAVVNWKEKRDLKMLYELRDQEDLVTYAYFVSLDGNLVFFAKCIGYGLPYSTQFSNPAKIKTHEGYGTGGADWAITVPQAEPNGLFVAEGLSATWLMVIDEETEKVRPVYVEPQIVVSPIKLH
jgi:hypothetical protein